MKILQVLLLNFCMKVSGQKLFRFRFVLRIRFRSQILIRFRFLSRLQVLGQFWIHKQYQIRIVSETGPYPPDSGPDTETD
jgi:hypothetical protein